MIAPAAVLLLAMASAPQQLGPGDHLRKLTVDGLERCYVVHIPEQYDPKRPTPVVLVLHGAMSNANLVVPFTGMSRKSSDATFISVYPNATGTSVFLAWNAGGKRRQPDDVKFISLLLDDLATVANMDRKRIYATGCSNGGMMCYRLAAELSDRIAAIAPVAATMVVREAKPTRPVSVIHFHGTADPILPLNGSGPDAPEFLKFRSVKETIRIWCKIDGCPETPKVTTYPQKVASGTTVKQMTYGPGRDGAEVVLVEVEGGGHTWPGQKPPFDFLGKSTFDISANDMIWEFFQKHPMK